jgi:protein-S-isoprenylcysteine O-methyltransferase Ste14
VHAPVRAYIAFVGYLVVLPAMLFVLGGTLDWPMAWVYMILLVSSTVGSRLVVWRQNPDTLRERAQFTAAEGTRAWDRTLVMIVGFYGPLATVIVAGLDQRWGWSVLIPEAGQYLAASAMAAGFGLGVWAMVTNRFFSAVARIQEDRGQQVVTSGPYRFVRHPSYAGVIVAALALPLMLDAVWALIPALSVAVALVVRTALEDRMLTTELDGYQEYAQQTRYRLIPGLW